MTDDLLFLRILVASGSHAGRDLFRQAASAPKVPVEIVEADSAAAAERALTGGVDFAFIDHALGDEAIVRLVARARGTPKPPFTVLLCAAEYAGKFQTDALADMPANLEQAKNLVSGMTRAKLPSHVLLVDDSATMRSIVCKILAATSFPFEVTEVAQGTQALEIARNRDFDIAIIDYHMPGFNGLETIGEFRRVQQQLGLVLMTSTPDPRLADRARALGAAFLEKPFFPADLENVLCGFYALRALNPQRASGP